ncbi:MAG: Fic family protein [Victivallales bacterium]|nr:Fic family protein [Victivallales bacterium]
MKRGIQGHYETVSTVGERVKAFIPSPLPPIPSLELSGVIQKKLDTAYHSLGRLDAAAELLPDVGLLLYMFIRKEAVLSSMIEGTQSSLSDLLLFELDEVPGVPLDDVQEVSNYVSVMNYGLRRLNEGFPLSLCLIREIHGELLSKGRGSLQTPGEFRRSQNWIGGTRPDNAIFVPPPADAAIQCLNELEVFLHDDEIPVLIKAALAHVQFETIHPFLDGNGRVGRLLITLLLCNAEVLKQPLLYLSYYFKSHRRFYYELLNDIRDTGDWERWLDFFLDAVIETARQSNEIILAIDKQIKEDRKKISSLGRGSQSAAQVHQAMRQRPIIDAGTLCCLTQLSNATVNAALARLEKLNIVEETTGNKRNRLFCYSSYLQLLNQEMDLPK